MAGGRLPLAAGDGGHTFYGTRLGLPERLPVRAVTGMDNPSPFFNPLEDVRRHQGNLPHWQQAGVITFVTFRLADAVAVEVRLRWREEQLAWEHTHPEPRDEASSAEFRRRFSARREAWLDAGHGACWLRRPECAAEVVAALWYFDGDRYALGDFMVMPNHAHVLVRPKGGRAAGEIVAAWKSWTARRINAVVGRKGAVWMDESFDHLVRNEAQLAKLREYIRMNPIKAGLAAGNFSGWVAAAQWPA